MGSAGDDDVSSAVLLRSGVPMDDDVRWVVEVAEQRDLQITWQRTACDIASRPTPAMTDP
jgi:hypothetical protein